MINVPAAYKLVICAAVYAMLLDRMQVKKPNIYSLLQTVLP